MRHPRGRNWSPFSPIWEHWNAKVCFVQFVGHGLDDVNCTSPGGLWEYCPFLPRSSSGSLHSPTCRKLSGGFVTYSARWTLDEAPQSWYFNSSRKSLVVQWASADQFLVLQDPEIPRDKRGHRQRLRALRVRPFNSYVAPTAILGELPRGVAQLWERFGRWASYFGKAR